MPEWVCDSQCPFWREDFRDDGTCVKHLVHGEGLIVGRRDQCHYSLARWEIEHARLGDAIAARRKMENPDV